MLKKRNRIIIYLELCKFVSPTAIIKNRELPETTNLHKILCKYQYVILYFYFIEIM